jgi:ElaA protein
VYTEPSIGRVLTAKEYRGKGLGKLLMEEGHKAVNKLFPGSSIQIGAQLYLKEFYESFGYTAVTEPYDLDGIQHIGMVRQP